MPTPDTATLASPARRRLIGGRATTHQPAPTAATTAASAPPAAVRWLSKATYGFTATDLAALNALGGNDNARWTAWIDRQLAPDTINDNVCNSRLAAAGFTTLNKTVSQLWANHHEGDPNYFVRMLPQRETECATVIRAIYSERQLLERVAGFWHDHFNVYGNDFDIGPIFPSYDRDVIRFHALGNFRSLLGAVAKSTAMLIYLDNADSQAPRFNENYARELIELHTLGVENYYGAGTSPWDVPCTAIREVHCPDSMPAGYVDNDVYEAAAALTGWTIKDGHWQFPELDDGTFFYFPDWHDNRNKLFLGLYMPANQPAMMDGEQILDRLCQHPGTARHIAGKLCRRFIGESVSETLVEGVAASFASHLQDSDQIARMLRVILESAEFKNRWGEGMKRPFESTMAGLRALGADFTPTPDDTSEWTGSEEFFSRLEQTGHRPFRWVPPNGFPDDMQSWSSSGALGMTLKLLSRLPELRQGSGDAPMPRLADLVAQTKAALPAQADRTAANIIGYWCNRVLGWHPQPLASTVTAFLQQDAQANEPLDLDSEGWSNWQQSAKNYYVQSRLRTAVGMLLMNPHFLLR